MRFVIVTGMSGAGKSSAMKILEDDGFFCVDNLPASLLSTFMQLLDNSNEEIDRVAIGVDVRAGEKELSEIANLIDELKNNGYNLEVLFFDAGTQVLVKRYKETRRVHPLARGARVDNGIEKERILLEQLKKKANYIIDTTTFLIRDLKAELERIVVNGDSDECNFYITFISFGFKYGIPTDADLVFDVRFLPNPFYVNELKFLSGDDKEVYDFVMSSPNAGLFLEKLEDMLEFLVPNYIIEGKNQMVVAIGCTGGKHRSVTLTNAIFSKFSKSKYGCKKEHRDIEKDRKRLS